MLQIPMRDKLNIHIIGAGGTGGYLAETLARLLSGEDHEIHLHDGDHVELKNLKRQNFTELELDVNKSTALANRITEGIPEAPNITAHDAYITDKDEFMIELITSFDTDNESLIVVSALDNIASRKLINQTIMEDLKESGVPVVMLDSGNDDQGGQVVLYANAPIRYKPVIGKESIGNLPTMLEVFPDLAKVDDENPGIEMSCEDVVESYPQAMMANVRNSDILADIIYQLYNTGTVPYNLWRSNIGTATTTAEFTGFKEEG